MNIIKNENIFPLDELSCHASHFVLLDGGKIFAVWFYGTAEGKDDVCIWGSLNVDGKWEKPRRLTADDGQPHWNPVLHLKENGTVQLYYKVGKPIGEWHTEVIESKDGCLSFGESRELVPGDRSGGRGPVRNKMIVLSDGSYLAPGSTEVNDWRCFTDRSVDGGITWERSRDICIPESDLRKQISSTEKARGLLQPTLWEDPSNQGNVSALMRSTEGFIYRSDSFDYGVSWCVPYKTHMQNNNSGIDVAGLSDGRLFLVCNPCGVPDDKVWGVRTPLSLFLSKDNGETFKKVTDIATGEGVFAYPAVRYRNGELHITYTWNRKMIMYVCLGID